MKRGGFGNSDYYDDEPHSLTEQYQGHNNKKYYNNVLDQAMDPINRPGGSSVSQQSSSPSYGSAKDRYKSSGQGDSAAATIVLAVVMIVIIAFASYKTKKGFFAPKHDTAVEQEYIKVPISKDQKNAADAYLMGDKKAFDEVVYRENKIAEYNSIVTKSFFGFIVLVGLFYIFSPSSRGKILLFMIPLLFMLWIGKIDGGELIYDISSSVNKTSKDSKSPEEKNTVLL